MYIPQMWEINAEMCAEYSCIDKGQPVSGVGVF